VTQSSADFVFCAELMALSLLFRAPAATGLARTPCKHFKAETCLRLPAKEKPRLQELPIPQSKILAAPPLMTYNP
jgi:hypothetical protein